MMELKESRSAFNNLLLCPDEHSFGVFRMLEAVYPSFSKKLFDGNDIMQRLVMSGHNPMDIMDYPICGSCETLAPYSGYAMRGGKAVAKCTCMNQHCNKTTVDPITLRTWAKYELKKKAPPEYIEALDYAIDEIARSMVEKHRQTLANALMKERGQKKQAPIVNTELGNKPTIEHYSTGTEELEKEYKEMEGE